MAGSVRVLKRGRSPVVLGLADAQARPAILKTALPGRPVLPPAGYVPRSRTEHVRDLCRRSAREEGTVDADRAAHPHLRLHHGFQRGLAQVVACAAAPGELGGASRRERSPIRASCVPDSQVADLADAGDGDVPGPGSAHLPAPVVPPATPAVFRPNARTRSRR